MEPLHAVALFLIAATLLGIWLWGYKVGCDRTDKNRDLDELRIADRLRQINGGRY